MPALTVVFDLDGTLVDTAPDLITTLNLVLDREALRPVDYAQARLMIGGGARKMIEAGLRFAGRPAETALVDRMFSDFIAYYSTHIADHSRPFAGLETALDALAARGCRLAVCTNKLEGLSRHLLEALGMTSRFSAICGQDTFGMAKPDPEVLRRTIVAAGGQVEHAVMVGDSGTDIVTARAAGVPVVAVDFGYSEEPIASLGADRLISHFDQLMLAVEALARRDG